MPNCLWCGKALSPVAPGARGHRARLYCQGGACKQAHFRSRQRAQQHPLAQDSAATYERLAELEQEKAALEAEVGHLRERLDLERRYHQDTQVRGFKIWLKKQPGQTDFTRRLLADSLMPPRGSRGMYEAHVRRMGCSVDERGEFEHLWKALLLQS